MRFNKHYALEDKHAFLGASKHHWTDYEIEKLRKVWTNQFASARGTRIHHIAKLLILDGIRMEPNGTTLNTYVNDAIRFSMTPEQVLFFSENAFGTADAISFENQILRIHDLKTGVHPGHPRQLEIYDAYFCLEYQINPYDIEMINRIYQMDEVREFTPDPKEIVRIMEKTVECHKEIELMKEVMSL